MRRIGSTQLPVGHRPTSSARAASHFAPYTNPSTNLYFQTTTYPNYDDLANCPSRQIQDVYSGLTLSNVHWVTAPGSGQAQMSVTLRYDGDTPPTGPCLVPDETVWADLVQLGTDVEVPAGSTLTIREGTEIRAAAEYDARGTGADPDAIEIVVNGTIVFEGTSAGSVVFTSSRDGELVGFPGESETTSAAGGDWFGLRLGASASLVMDAQAANGVVTIKYASGAVNYSVSEFPSTLQQGMDKILFVSNLVDVTFDRDVTVPSGQTRSIPAGLRVGFAPHDVQNAADGRDAERVELIVKGTLMLDGAQGDEIELTSTKGSPAAGDWYGIRLASFGQVTRDHVAIKHTRAAFAYEGSTAPDLAALSNGFAANAVTLQSNLCLVSWDRDWIMSQATTIPAGFVFGFTHEIDASHAANSVDDSRAEILFSGSGSLAFGSGAILRSDDPASRPGGWYGIRTSNFASNLSITPGAGTIRNARGAIALENADGTWPNLATLQSDLTFEDNVSEISVDRDRRIGTAQSLTVPAGLRIGFTAQRDATGLINGGADPDRAELIVEGTGDLNVNGTSVAPAAFVSDDPQPEDDDWYGMRFLLTGIHQTGYAFLECTTAPATPCALGILRHAEVGDAKYGVSLEGMRAPTLDSLSFRNNQVADIFLNDSDVYVPSRVYPSGAIAEWHLVAPTRVVATNQASDEDSWYGEPGKVDLIIQGKLFTASADPDNLKVTFAPQTPTASTSEDWGGLILDSSAAGSVVSAIDIGYAAVPIFMFYPSSLTKVEKSTIHHFSETGIWVLGAMGQGGVLYDNEIVRGAGLNTDRGNVGIFLDQADEINVLDNIVDLAGLANPPEPCIGIDVAYGKWLCDHIQGTGQTLLIDGNEIKGPGTSVSGRVLGMHVGWVCGSTERSIDITSNRVHDFPTFGMNFEQASDVQVSGNCVKSVRDAAVEVNGDSAGVSADVRFRLNRLEALTQQRVVLRSDYTPGSTLGTSPSHGSTLDRGLNALVRRSGLGTDSYFVREDDTSLDTGHVLPAGNNRWKRINAAQVEVAVTIESQVRAFIKPDTARVYLGTLETTDPDDPCAESIPSGAERRGSRLETLDDDVASAAPGEIETVGTLPERTEIGRPVPNPTRGGVQFALGVARNTGVVEVKVFDVTGRLVDEVVDEALVPGWYRVHWRGADRSGQRVSSGIYFLRLRTAQQTQVQKVTFLR